MTETAILDESAVDRCLKRAEEARSPEERPHEWHDLILWILNTDIPALCATVKHLRARLDSIKSKTAWHRDGIGPDVPVMQERYDNLIAQRNDLQSQLEQLRAENERLKGELIEPSCWHCGVVLTGVPKRRCEDCLDECDVVNCDAYGCADKLAEQHLDSWK